jgi:hypothetical protein
MANSLATCSIIAKESLAILENMLGFSKGVNRDFEDTFTSNQARGYSPGVTINIKKPPRYTWRAGRVAVPQSTVETTVPLTLSQGGVDLSFLSVESTLSLQQKEKKLMAAVATVANEVDRQGLQAAYLATYNVSNSAGALPATQLAATQIFTDSNRRLDEMAAPRDKQRQFVLGPGLNGACVSGLAGLFNSASKISDQYGSGLMVDSFGAAVAMDQNIALHTNGTQVVTGTAVAAGLSGSSIACAALGGTIPRGTVIQFPGVFAVNPQSRVSTGVLAQFVVTSDLSGGAVALPISPALTPSGAFQNVSNTTTAANFTIVGAASTAYNVNMEYHRDAFTLACPALWTPQKGVIDSGMAENDGLAIRVVTFYDGTNDNAITRLDILFGWAATYPELANRIYSV